MAESRPTAELAALSTSAYATELRRGAGSRAFAAPLEAEYSRVHLAEHRTLVRVTALLALALAVPRGVEQILLDAWSGTQLIMFGVVLACSVLLALVAWSPWYARAYMPVAQVLVPLRGAVVAVTVAGVVSAGQLETLMLLPLLVIGPFFVLGLRFRAAVVASAIPTTAYVAAAVVYGIDWALLLRSTTLLLIVGAACYVVARTLERSARTRFLESHAMAELAQLDPLTALKNRRVFDKHLEVLWQKAVEHERAMAVLLIDVDHFKAYNDRYGHQAGDRALRRLAQVLQAVVNRPDDLLARYGGEELAVLLYDVSSAEAEKLAERMRKAVCGLAIEHRGSRSAGVVTISIGVGIVSPSVARRARGGLQLADEALYLAKTRGRNRVEVLDQDAHQALETGVFAKGTALGG